MYVNVARFTEWGVLGNRRAFFREHFGNATHGRSSEKGLSVLRAIRSFWQPTAMPEPWHRPLDRYGRTYRYEVLAVLEACHRNSDRQGRREALRIAREILPRLWDRTFVRMPRIARAIMWRLEGK